MMVNNIYTSNISSVVFKSKAYLFFEGEMTMHRFHPGHLCVLFAIENRQRIQNLKVIYKTKALVVHQRSSGDKAR